MASPIAFASASASSLSAVIQINPSTQLPLKLDNSNYPTWYLQFDTLLTGLDLIGFINGDTPCPPATVVDDKTKKYVPNQEHIYGFVRIS